MPAGSQTDRFMQELPSHVVLQVCHTTKPPFDDVARQWRALFADTPYQVVTVFLTGEADERVARLVGGKVVFLGYRSRDLRGLKRRPIADLRRLHRHYRFQLVIGHRYKPLYIAGHIKDVPLLAVSHGAGVYRGLFRQLFIHRQRKRALLLGVSDAVCQEIKDTLPHFPRQQIQTLYNHVDLARLQQGQLDRVEARRQLGLPEGAVVIGNVGRLHEDKDQKTLMAAYASVAANWPSSALAIIGAGPLEGALRQQAAALGIGEQVHFLGWVPEAWRYFRAFDLFALSSVREGFGMVLVEAMAAEVPVISSRAGGAPEVVGDCGWLFDAGDVAALATLLVEATATREGRQGVKRVQQLFSETAARQRFWQLMGESGWLRQPH